MTIPPPGRLPRRVLVPVRLPEDGSARATQLIAHGCWALALPPLSPHVRAKLGPPGAPLTSHAAVQRLGPLVVCRFAVFVLEQEWGGIRAVVAITIMFMYEDRTSKFNNRVPYATLDRDTLDFMRYSWTRFFTPIGITWSINWINLLLPCCIFP